MDKVVPALATGQLRCFDVAGATVPCEGSGQDGETRKGLAWPDPRFDADADTVVDRLTGLVWTRDAGLTEFPLAWSESSDFIDTMNGETWFGHDDWRLPNRRELRSLVSYRRVRPALLEGHPFINVFGGWYWTSTPFAGHPDHAWYVNLEGARMFYGGKDQSYMVWPVRGNSTVLPVIGAQASSSSGVPWPSPRFRASGDGVLDRLTGLQWRRSTDLCGEVLWGDALTAVKALGDGWRLPNINELESLVDADCFAPALPHAHVFDAVRDIYWSSTTSEYGTDWAWALYLDKGAVGVGHKPFAHFSVWPVRDAR